MTSPKQLGAQLLDDVREFIGRFVAFPSPAALNAATLWAAMTHVAEHFHTTPRLALLSPEPGSGKTRVLEVLALLTHNPLLALNASPATIFRMLSLGIRTLLFDEVDAIWTKRGKDAEANEDLRALLNSGYRRGASVPRCVPPRMEVEYFAVYSPVALAGLGDLPNTLMSRSIIIRMRKRLPTEHVEPFRLRVHEPQALPLNKRIVEWAAQIGADAGDAWPDLPPGVEDRAAELWEPLIAIADVAGGHWPSTARAACLDLLRVAEERDVSLGVRLLMDLRTVFGDADAMTTADILEALHGLEESPWADLYGKELQPRQLAQMLRQYEVRSKKVKVAGKSLQGYRREDLWEAWERYAPIHPNPAEAEPPEPMVPTSAIHGPQAKAQASTHRADLAAPPEPVAPLTETSAPLVPPLTHETESQKRAHDVASSEVPEVPDLQAGRRATRAGTPPEVERLFYRFRAGEFDQRPEHHELRALFSQPRADAASKARLLEIAAALEQEAA